MTATHSRLDRGLILATLLLLLWLPLPLGSNREWSSAIFMLAVPLLAGLWAWRQARTPETHGGWRSRSLGNALPLLGILALAQLWVALQWLSGLSADGGETFRYLMLGINYGLLFLLIIGLFNRRDRLTLLVATLVLSGGFQAFYGAFMTLSGLEWSIAGFKESYRGVVTGTFVNRNHMAGYLEMTIALGIGLLLALRDGRSFHWKHLVEWLMGPKALIRLSLVIMVIALVMTRSRMGNTAFFSSLLLIGGLFILASKEHRLRNGLILASLLLIDVLVISQYFGLDKLKDRIINTQLEDQIISGQVIRRENEVRDDIVIYAIPQLQEKPWTGFGAGSFESSFQKYPGPDVPPHFDHAHNDFLQFAIEFGLIGMAPLVAFVLGCFWHALRAMLRTESWYRSGVGFGAAMGLLALMIHSATDFNLQIPANAATCVALCAIAVLARFHNSPRRQVSSYKP